LSQCLLAGLFIPIDAISCINTEPAVAPVHELADEIIGYLTLAFSMARMLERKISSSCFISHREAHKRTCSFEKGRQRPWNEDVNETWRNLQRCE